MLKSTVFISIIFILLNYLFTADSYGQELNLRIEGKDSIETKIIDSLKYRTRHADFNSLQLEIARYKNKLDQIGYLEHTLQATVRKDSLLTATLYLGKRYNSLKIFYTDSLVSKKVLASVTNKITENYFIIPIQETEKTLATINLKLSELGDPFNEIKLSHIRIHINSSQIEANLIASEKTTLRHIDKIIIKGYEKFPISYLKYYLRIKKSDLFNLTQIKKQITNLNELPFANHLKDPEVLFTKDSTTLYLYIQKVKSNSFNGFIGFGTNEKSNKLEFSGYLNLELNNNLNYGESFRLVYKSDESEQKTFHVNLSLPYLFGSPIGTELELMLIKKDSSYSTADQNAKLFYQLNPKNKLFTGIRSIQSNNLLQATYSNPNIKDYKTLFYNIGYQYVKLQKENLLFNMNTKLNLQVETGHRMENKNRSNQHQVALDVFHIVNLNEKNNIYLRTQGHGLFSETYFENELVLFGGINSIRGFEENSLSATLFGVFNTEYRYVFNNSLYAHTIIDFAYLENQLIDQRENLYSFGFGFGLITKAGLLKFNFANGKTKNQSFKFTNSQVHLSLTAFF